jgi:hypothetical protein
MSVTWSTHGSWSDTLTRSLDHTRHRFSQVFVLSPLIIREELHERGLLARQEEDRGRRKGDPATDGMVKAARAAAASSRRFISASPRLTATTRDYVKRRSVNSGNSV